MRGVLGGFRNMLRQWRINYRRHKKKKQQEIEEGKLAKYYTLKRMAYSGLALMYYPFSLFHSETQKETQEYPDLVRIKKDISSVQEKTLKISPKQKEKAIEKIEKQIQRIEKKIKETPFHKDKPNQKEVDILLQQLKKEIRFLKEPVVFKTKNVSIKVDNKKEDNSSLFTLNESSKENVNKKAMKVEFARLQIATSPILPVNKKETQPEEKNTQLLFLKDSKTEKENVKKIKEELEILAYHIVTAKDYALFYEYEKKLKFCKKELEEMLDNLEKANLMGILSDMEEKERQKPITELLDQVKVLEKTIIERKNQIYTAKPQPKEEKKAVEKKEPVKEEQKKKEVLISEWQQAQAIIMQQIEQQRKQLLEFEKKKNKVGKKGLWKTLSSLASNAIHFLFSMTPLAIFKNKILGTLVTTIMVNNSLKSMKKLLHPQAEINYEWLGEELKEKQSILQNIYFVSKDSLSQIDDLREDVLLLLKENPENKEIISLLEQLDVIEKETLMVSERVKKETNIIDRQYTKVFTKKM